MYEHLNVFLQINKTLRNENRMKYSQVKKEKELKHESSLQEIFNDEANIRIHTSRKFFFFTSKIYSIRSTFFIFPLVYSNYSTSTIT